MIPLRLWLYLGAAVVVGLLVWRVMAWHAGYMERDAAQAELKAANEKYADEVKAWQADIAKATEQANKDAELVKATSGNMVKIQADRDRLLASVAELKARGGLTHETPSAKPGGCPVVRLGPDVRVQFNAAGAATDPPH